MKKRLLSIIMVMVVLFTCAPYMMTQSVQAEQAALIDTSTIFNDISQNKWYKQAVDYVVTHGIFSGTSSNTFSPTKEMTRAQFVQVLANVTGVDTSDKNVTTVFSDAPAGKWFTPAVKWANDNGIVTGIGNGKFAPNDNVTREQICVMMVRYSNFRKIVLNQKNAKTDFVDDKNISSWAKDDVYTCQRAGIVNGKPDGSFDPKATGTRVESAQILMVFHSDNERALQIPPYTNGNGIVIDSIPSDDFVVQNVVSNDNGFVPDEKDAILKSAMRATEASIYNFDENPIINAHRSRNKTYLPSFDIDETGFVRAGTKLKDLKGKTLSFFTADNYTAWSYRNEKGETINEWQWFKDLKSELGLNVEYYIKTASTAMDAALAYMNAGKQCDIIYTNTLTFPASICLSRSITELVNINNLGSSPGVCQKTMDICKWGNTYRVISPVGVVDVLWYNQTLNSELKLSDPHKMWEAGVWNWDTFESYMLSIPKTTLDGRKLTALVQWPSSTSYIWPSTNGQPHIFIDADAEIPTIINNWNNPETLEAWEFITSVCNNIYYGASPEESPGNQKEHLGLFDGTTLMSATMYTQVYRDTEYSKNIQLNWVPYPKSNNEGGREICQYMGYGMMLPKKTVKQDNVNFALKFMELWATRFTETVFDNLNIYEYYNFNYAQRKQYYDFVTQNVVFALPMNDFRGSGIDTQTNFFNCFKGQPAYNIKTDMQKAARLVNDYVIKSIQYGQ